MPHAPSHLRVASVNVNGIRAAVRKGMREWLDAADVDVLTLQEVRGEAEHLAAALPGWHVVNDEALAKGRAGVAIAAREPIDIWRTELTDGTLESLDSRGRWVEADIRVGDEVITVVSAYVHTGEDGTPKQDAKYAFLDAMTARMRQLGPLALITGDLNVGHRELDIRNWRGNVKKAGFLPRERAYFDRFTGATGAPVTGVDGSTGPGLGWVDVGRRFAGEVDGPYTWWSSRGKAFDTDTGWRIDYHLATPELAARVADYRVVRAPSWDTRWSDHAPVVADYTI
ncbi:endonuclease/exonuclease/phosphatase family protein [Microbacterium flavum]|uniref:Endonuclease/exonuclease/phosphatase family protein n=1 Tax=Microbacterium flavum TaxID=415216 RepID=A0ABS5XUF7_9MICO|nr:endonuclease/exonuclease/phosphatase family protein [Microbacterium flavum]MBT8798169.1 endonuclease/exonuclease/phosphatase family protein [Microbacterium flavum]